MRYVDKITLKLDYRGNPHVDEVLFSESICKPCNELYDSGYIDKTDYAIIGHIGGIKLRFSEYLPLEQVYQHIFRLREFYNVVIMKEFITMKIKLCSLTFMIIEEL